MGAINSPLNFPLVVKVEAMAQEKGFASGINFFIHDDLPEMELHQLLQDALREQRPVETPPGYSEMSP